MSKAKHQFKSGETVYLIFDGEVFKAILQDPYVRSDSHTGFRFRTLGLASPNLSELDTSATNIFSAGTSADQIFTSNELAQKTLVAQLRSAQDKELADFQANPLAFLIKATLDTDPASDGNDLFSTTKFAIIEFAKKNGICHLKDLF